MLLVLSILIGALTGLAVVAFIVLTERLGMRLYPVGTAAWRRMLIPVAGPATPTNSSEVTSASVIHKGALAIDASPPAV